MSDRKPPRQLDHPPRAGNIAVDVGLSIGKRMANAGQNLVACLLCPPLRTTRSNALPFGKLARRFLADRSSRGKAGNGRWGADDAFFSSGTTVTALCSFTRVDFEMMFLSAKSSSDAQSRLLTIGRALTVPDPG